jgi:hypothetical protein
MNGRSSAELERAKLPGVQSSGLKQQAKNESNNKVLATGYNSICKRLKLEKILTPSLYFALL